MKNTIDPLEDLEYDGFEKADKVTLPVKLAQILAPPERKCDDILVVKGCDLSKRYSTVSIDEYAIFFRTRKRRK